MRTLRVAIGALVLAMGLGTMVGVGPALAQSPAPAVKQTKVTMTSTPRLDSKNKPVAGQVILTAKLTTAEGKPVNNQTITFLRQVELFGAREARIASEVTDSTGTASVLFKAPEAGSYAIKVQFGGDSSLAATEGTATVQVAVGMPPIHSEPVPFASVRQVLPYGLGFLVIAVWAILLGTLFGTVRGVVAEAGEEEPSRERATVPATNRQ